MDELITVVEDLPDDARELVEKASQQVGKLQARAHKDVAAVQQQAEQKIDELNEQCRQKVQTHLEKLVAELKPLQMAYAKEGKLDEALAIREQIKQFKGIEKGAEPDPGNLVSLQSQIGRSFLFEVMGKESGSLWGTDVYTTDSELAVAAVHAGKLAAGQRGVVRVTVVQPPPSFQGTTRHGVTSYSYGSYPGAYRVG